MDDIVIDDTSQYVSSEPESFVQAMGSQNENPIFINPKGSIPVIPIDDTVAFPRTPRTIPVDNDDLKNKLSDAIKKNSPVFLVQKKDSVSSPSASELYRIGCIAKICQQMETPDNRTHAFIEVFDRYHVTRYQKTKEGLSAILSPFPILNDKDEVKELAVLQQLEERFRYYISLKEDHQEKMILQSLEGINDPMVVISLIGTVMPVSGYLKQQALERQFLSEIAEVMLEHLEVTIRLYEIRKELEIRTHADLSAQQKENFLHNQIRQIQNELGQGTDVDVENFMSKASTKNWSSDVQEHFNRELNKLQRYNIASPDYSIQYTYLDKFLSLPWDNYSPDDFSISHVEEVLNRDHFGLEKVKDRILDQMAVIKLRKDLHAPILCLVGPPGVGKTSLGKSIADSMGREYKRIALGGMHDEAEIRGHRRTYIGAMPGRIIAALEKCNTSNPVIVLDEIDKIGNDFKGDPSSALLEVLDPEQNNAFHDNYLDRDYDLSKILFIATANSLSTVSAPLMDRMEIISLSGYITAEKVEIAKRHLIPKLLKEMGFDEHEIEFDTDSLIYLIDYYTRESGVRRLEKMIAKLLRKIARLKVSEKPFPSTITRDTVSSFLGKEEFNPEMYENNNSVGVVTGLAWTSVGGEILFIESSVTDGDGKLSMTGNLGDVMKESATIAVQYLKANANLIDLTADEFKKHDIHIHVPEGAIPKDGPSAGITLVTSVASAMTGRKVKSYLAMTGEITLRGKVLPVGGIKEKIIAAKRAGIKEIILCKENRKDVEEINRRYLSNLKFTYVDSIDKVLEIALV